MHRIYLNPKLSKTNFFSSKNGLLQNFDWLLFLKISKFHHQNTKISLTQNSKASPFLYH
jgi:hypothetical protein